MLNIMLSYKTALLMIWNDLLHEFIDKAVVVLFCKRFRSFVAATCGLPEHCEHSVFI